MRGLGRRFTTVTVLVCLHAVTWACSSRPSSNVPVLREPDKPPDPPSTVAEAPVLLPTAPAATPFRADTEPGECALLTAPGGPIATVALTDRIDPANAPHPSNEGERLLFRQLYETLIRVDCLGRAVPGLAESWRLDADGRTWIVTLRENARFSDGTPLTANDVRASWTRDGIGDVLRPDVSRLVQSIVAVGDRDLAVALERHRADAPLALAHQDLAIARRAAASRWPLGTRPGGLAADEVGQRSAASIVTLTRANLPSIRFLIAPGDPRDLLDRDIDLLLTRDPVALDYAATLPQFQVLALFHRGEDAVSALRIIGGSLLASYVSAVVVNTVRIAIALRLAAHPASLPSLSAADVHRLEGIAVYFGGLVLLHELVRRLDRRAFAPGRAS